MLINRCARGVRTGHLAPAPAAASLCACFAARAPACSSSWPRFSPPHAGTTGLRPPIPERPTPRWTRLRTPTRRRCRPRSWTRPRAWCRASGDPATSSFSGSPTPSRRSAISASRLPSLTPAGAKRWSGPDRAAARSRRSGSTPATRTASSSTSTPPTRCPKTRRSWCGSTEVRTSSARAFRPTAEPAVTSSRPSTGSWW